MTGIIKVLLACCLFVAAGCEAPTEEELLQRELRKTRADEIVQSMQDKGLPESAEQMELLTNPARVESKYIDNGRINTVKAWIEPYIFVDPKTQCNYLIIAGNNETSITIRYRADGTIWCPDIKEKTDLKEKSVDISPDNDYDGYDYE